MMPPAAAVSRAATHLKVLSAGAVKYVVTDVAARPVEVSDAFYRADRYRYEVETRLPPATRRPNPRTVRLRRGVRTVLQP